MNCYEWIKIIVYKSVSNFPYMNLSKKIGMQIKVGNKFIKTL